MAKLLRALMLLLAALMLFAVLGNAEEEEGKGYKYTPYRPVFRANEKFDYSIYWNGLKVGYMNIWSGDTPAEGQPLRYYFVSKSSRLGKILLRFFSTSGNSRTDREDGSSQGFFRHLARDEAYLEETVNFHYDTMDLLQVIKHDRRRRAVERFRLIEDRMLDPVSLLWHMRAVKFEKVGDKREYYLFADGFFTVTMTVASRKTLELPDLGERDVWVVETAVPRPMLSFRTGSFSLEIDVQTGIILSVSWDDTGGTCRARLTKAENSPLPFPNDAADGDR